MGDHALHDAGDLWKMPRAPVYGGPLCIDGGLSGRSIRCARRGLQWVRLDLVHGLSGANRRESAELRARTGYGRYKSENPPVVRSNREEFGRDLSRHMAELHASIAHRRS